MNTAAGTPPCKGRVAFAPRAAAESAIRRNPPAAGAGGPPGGKENFPAWFRAVYFIKDIQRAKAARGIPVNAIALTGEIYYNRAVNINISSAKSYFMELMDEVEKGREYFILKQGKPVAQVLPVREDALSRREVVEKLFSFQTLK